MKKQIIYPKFIPRLFSMTIDLVILSIALTPLMNIISRYVFVYTFYQFFVDFSINIHDTQAIAAALRLPEFNSYISTTRFFGYIALLFVLNSLFMGGYFVFFWRKFGATPGKMVMRMKIVDADDYSRPSVYRLCKRFCGYITVIIGIFSMIISKNGRATHDKIANTVVIKS
ncbi:MAG: RDD family protein [Rickettsiaceae bacterium]